MALPQPHPASYRDPSGFIFEKDGIMYRQVNQSYKTDFDLLETSGCLKHFTENGLLLNVEKIDKNLTGSADWYTTLLPDQLPFISYPYEWSFDMLKDAAILSLQLAKESIPFGLILKDATPSNIQWYQGKMIFIDTLSFETYNASKPWIAYRQFCECFLGPLLLMHYSKQHLPNLMIAYPEGIPLPVSRSLLPFRSRFSFFTYLHIHLHARLTEPGKAPQQQRASFSKTKMLNLLNSLEAVIKKLNVPGNKTTWSEYYQEANLRGDYLKEKENIIQNWLAEMPGMKSAIDLGANDGYFSQLLSSKNLYTIAAEADANCINRLYVQNKQKKISSIQPLILDLTNPSPAIGVNNKERASFLSRTKADLAVALALIHHLCIGKNMSFEQSALLFSSVAPKLIIEFVPKNDEKTKMLLINKKDIYANYTIDEFEKTFSRFFRIEKKQIIPGTERVLYLMNKL